MISAALSAPSNSTDEPQGLAGALNGGVREPVEPAIAILIAGAKAAHEGVKTARLDERVVGPVRIITAGLGALMFGVEIVAEFMGEHRIRAH